MTLLTVSQKHCQYLHGHKDRHHTVYRYGFIWVCVGVQIHVYGFIRVLHVSTTSLDTALEKNKPPKTTPLSCLQLNV